VAGLAGAVQVAGGHYHSLALLGDGTTTRRTTPVPVPNLTGVETVTGGRAYSAAL
jgi:hypothetical protein